MCQWFNSTFGHIKIYLKMNKTIINTIIKLKNASLIKKEYVLIAYSNLNLKVINFLYKEGFIQSLKQKNKKLFVYLRYSFNKDLFSNLKIISTSTLNYYLSYKDLCKLTNKRFVLVLSTNKGFLTGLECKKHKIGGKLFFIF